MAKQTRRDITTGRFPLGPFPGTRELLSLMICPAPICSAFSTFAVGRVPLCHPHEGFGTVSSSTTTRQTVLSLEGQQTRTERKKTIRRDKTKGSVGWRPVHLGKHLCFRRGRERRKREEKMHLERDCCLPVCARRERRTALCICDTKSMAGRSPVAAQSSLPSEVLCSHACRQRFVLFSFPHHLLSQIPPSIACPGIEFQPMVENKRERNPTPAPTPTPCPCAAASLTTVPRERWVLVAPLGAGAPCGCWELLVLYWAGAGWECRAMDTVGSSSLVWPRPAAHSRLTPLFQITKLPRSHRATSDLRREPTAL